MIDRVKEATQHAVNDNVAMAAAWVYYVAVTIENFQGHRLFVHHIEGGMRGRTSWLQLVWNGVVIFRGTGYGMEAKQDFPGEGGLIFNQPGILELTIMANNNDREGWGSIIYTDLKKARI